MNRLLLIAVLACGLVSFRSDEAPTLKLGLLKYAAGDWYANPTALPNLSRFSNQNLGTNLDPEYAIVEVGSAELFNYPFVHMTGHGKTINRFIF